MPNPDVERSSVPLKDYLDSKFGEVNGGIAALATRLDALGRELQHLDSRVDSLGDRLTRVEGRLDTNESRVNEQRTNVRWALGFAIPAAFGLVIWLIRRLAESIMMTPLGP